MNEQFPNDHDTVAQRLSDVHKLQEVLKHAAHQAVVEHQRAVRRLPSGATTRLSGKNRQPSRTTGNRSKK